MLEPSFEETAGLFTNGHTFGERFTVFQQFFQVVGDAGQQHLLIGVSDALGIELAQAHVLGKDAKDGFYRALTDGF